MPTLVRRIVRRTLIAKAVVVALVVVVIGGSQLLLRQLPAHQDEVKAWVANELGLELEFSELHAGWSWRGPELEFGNASVKASGAAAQMRAVSRILFASEVFIDVRSGGRSAPWLQNQSP